MPELTFEDLFPTALVTQFNLHYSGIPQTSPKGRDGISDFLTHLFVQDRVVWQPWPDGELMCWERLYINIHLYL